MAAFSVSAEMPATVANVPLARIAVADVEVALVRTPRVADAAVEIGVARIYRNFAQEAD